MSVLGARGRYGCLSLSVFILIFFRVSLNLEGYDLAMLPGHQEPGFFLSLPLLQLWGDASGTLLWLTSYMGAGDPSSGPHSDTPNTLPTEPSP